MTLKFKQAEFSGRLPRNKVFLGESHADLADAYENGRLSDIRGYLEQNDTIAYAAGQFAKALRGEPAASSWCRDNELSLVKAQSTAVGFQGGVLAPEAVSAEVISLIESYGVLRSEGGTFDMTSESESMPRILTAFTAAWTGQNQQSTASNLTFDAVSHNAKKLSALGRISTELFGDASAKLGLVLILGMAVAFSKAEDDAAFIGDGTSTYGGVRGVATVLADGSHTAGKVTAASGHTTFGTIDGVDIGNAIAALPKRALRNAKLYISVTGYGAALARLGQSAGLVASIGPDGMLQANYAGLPVVFTQSLPTGTGTQSGKCLLCVGDLRQAVSVGLRRDLAIEFFDEPYAEYDQVLVKGTERIDIVPADLGDNANAGALVGLFAP